MRKSRKPKIGSFAMDISVAAVDVIFETAFATLSDFNKTEIVQKNVFFSG